MKLLLFSDLHCDVRAARGLVERSARVDVVVGAGDFATVRRGLDSFRATGSSSRQPLQASRPHESSRTS